MFKMWGKSKRVNLPLHEDKFEICEPVPFLDLPFIENKKPKFKTIKTLYKFKPRLNIWITKDKGETYIEVLSENYYLYKKFNIGYFISIQFKIFAIHIKLEWWKFNSFK